MGWVRRNSGVIGFLILAAFVFLGFVRQAEISDQRKGDLAEGQRAIIASQVQSCELDHVFREQYKIRGANLKTLAKVVRHQVKESERALKDPTVRASFSKKLLQRSHRQNQKRLNHLNAIIGSTHLLAVPDCRHLRRSLQSHLSVP